MSTDDEKLLKVLGSDEIAMQMMTSEEKELIARFNEEVDMLKEEKGIPDGSNEPDELIEEAFRLVPGAKKAVEKQVKIADNLFKAGSG